MPSLPAHAQRMPLSQEGWAETPEIIFHPLGLIPPVPVPSSGFPSSTLAPQPGSLLAA